MDWSNYNDWNSTGIAGPVNQLLSQSSEGRTLLDPLDLFGYRAKAAQEQAQQYADQALQLQSDWMDYIKQQYAPYSEVGQKALSQQMGLAGLQGNDIKQQFVDTIQNDPLYQAQVKSGDQTILRNAAATGGLRSGNVQSALAAQNSNLLNQEINNRYNQLAGLSGQGFQGASTGTNFGSHALSGMEGILGNLASGTLANYAAQQQNTNNAAGLGLGILGMFL